MQPFEIFTPGKHTAANGMTLEFSEDVLKEAVAGYDPALHEAPIVVGHPKDNHPAFGWIKGLQFSEGKIVAIPGDLDAEFSELVEKKRYKKRSASWYLPDAPNNPKPGTLYLRHVGFLGAMPPAIKGLRDVSFNEAEEGVVEFAETSPYVFTMIGSVLRGMRDWIIGKDGLETADKVIPSYYIDEVNSEAERMRQANNTATPSASVSPSFSEPQQEHVAMTPEEIAALQAENAAMKANAKQTADFAEQDKTLKAREIMLAKKETALEVDALITAGKVLPAQKAGLVEFMASLDDSDTTVEFGEGETAKKVSPRQFMKDFLSAQPKVVDFKEHSADSKPGAVDLTATELAAKATQYRDGLLAKGQTISFTEAVDAVQSGKTA